MVARDEGQIIRSAVQRVAIDALPILHRLQMAVLALIIADNQNRRRDAQRIVEIVDALEPTTSRENLEKSKVTLIYHAAFGNLDTAILAGKRVVESARQLGNSAALLKALRWLSTPLRLTNDMDGALDVLTEAFERASRLGLRAEMYNTSYYIASVALDFEDLNLSLKWAPIFQDLTNDATVHALRASHYAYFMARVEYLRGDLGAATTFLDQARGLLDRVPRIRGEQSLLALDVLLKIGLGNRVPGRILSRLRMLHIKSRDVGTRDFEAAGLIHGLVFTEQRREAESLLDYYLAVRRARTTLHSTLRVVQRELRGSADCASDRRIQRVSERAPSRS